MALMDDLIERTGESEYELAYMALDHALACDCLLCAAVSERAADEAAADAALIRRSLDDARARAARMAADGAIERGELVCAKCHSRPNGAALDCLAGADGAHSWTTV